MFCYRLRYVVRLFLLILLAFLSAPGYAEDPPQFPAERPGLDEQLGAQVPLDLVFADEDGRQVRLADLVDRPTILVPVYYRCTNVCNLLQAGLADALPQLNVKSDQLRILSVSFDPTETPEMARSSRRIYEGMLREKFPSGRWKFLTGDQKNISVLMRSIGYSYVKEGREFVHPVTVAILSPQGKVVRYLSGTRFLPMDLTLALMEASEGRVGSTISRIASFCFRYDPNKKGYVFNILRIAGTIVFVSGAGLFSVLAFGGRKKRRH